MRRWQGVRAGNATPRISCSHCDIQPFAVVLSSRALACCGANSVGPSRATAARTSIALSLLSCRDSCTWCDLGGPPWSTQESALLLTSRTRHVENMCSSSASCLVLSCLVLSCLVLSCLVLSCLVLSCLVLSCLVLSCLVLSCLVLSCLVLSCLVLSCLVLSCLVLSCLVTLAQHAVIKGVNVARFHMVFSTVHLDVESKHECADVHAEIYM